MIRMVVVDDQELALSGLCGLLDYSSIGFEVVGAYTSPREAQRHIQADPPDVVLTDIRMPELSGIELIESLTLAGIRSEFVLISSYRDFDAAKAAIRLGVARYIEKPFDREEVVAVLSALRDKLARRDTLPAISPHLPSTYQNNPVLDTLLAATAIHSRCYLILSEGGYAPAEEAHARTAPLAVSGYAGAWLLSSAKPIGAFPERTGASRSYPRFEGLPQMLHEADIALRGRFTFSDNREAADIQLYLCDNLAANLSLEELAGQFYMSRARLCSLFKAHTGFSPASFVQHIRLNMSRWQLLHTDARMRDVAEDVGYADYSYFGRLFKRAFGVTPEECRLHRELGEVAGAAGQ